LIRCTSPERRKVRREVRKRNEIATKEQQTVKKGGKRSSMCRDTNNTRHCSNDKYLS